MSGVAFEWIEQVDVTGDGQDDFLLHYTTEGEPAAAVVVNLEDRAEWADMQDLEGEEYGGPSIWRLVTGGWSRTTACTGTCLILGNIK